MSFTKTTCYTAACDDCRQPYEHDFVPHFDSVTDAIDEAINASDWWGDADLLLCDTCRYKPHAVVPDGNCCSRCGAAASDHDEPGDLNNSDQERTHDRG
jgi:hypothetical protein